MKNTKKILSVLLATLMMLSIFTIGFTASAADTINIDRVDITLKKDIAGKTSANYKDVYTVDTEHVSYLETGAVSFYEAGEEVTDKLVAGKTYDVKLSVVAEEGYAFSETTKVYVNGEVVADAVVSYDATSNALYVEIKDFVVERKLDGFDLILDIINGIKDKSFDTDAFFARVIEVVTNFFNDSVEFFTNLFNDIFRPAPAE